MSYRELSVIDVREMLRRWAAGHSDRKIARETGTDRKTVVRYTQLAKELGLTRGVQPSDDEVHEIAQRVQSRPLVEPSAEWLEIMRYKAQIEAWFEAPRPLRLTKIHKLLTQDYGLTASYATLRRFVQQELGWHKRAPTIRLDDPPAGEQAQIDFGKMGVIPDGSDGRHRVLWVLVVTLAHSRYQFVWPSFTQTTEAVCEALDRAWQFFGGTPKVIVPDNMKAIVAQPDELSPKLTDAFLDYAQARDIFVDPARIRSPKDKARVENQVAYVRESWFDGEAFANIAEARESAARWCRDVAGMRVHGTTRKVPREVFETHEKPTLRPAPSELFDVPIWTEAKVHPDHHIQVAKALYSVPTKYLHKTVRVRADRTTVKVYFGSELIKMHPRKAPGQRSTDPNDYPVGKAAYARSSIDTILVKAKEKGAHVGIYAERVLSGPLPWARMRQAYALLRLCDKYGDGRVEAVCQSALAFDVIDVARIGRMLKTAAKLATPTPREAKVVQLTLPRFARAEDHFRTQRKGSSQEEA